jgi:hypothetical protein
MRLCGITGRFMISVILCSGCLAGVALAEDIHYRGWGPRVGLATKPDQVIGGAHFDLGEFAPNVRFMPNAELGLGDDATVVSVTAPVHYIWRDLRNTNTMPYVGGGVTLAYVDTDRGGSDFEIGLKATGGAQWRLKSGRGFLVELSLGLGDVHDVEVVAGWLFTGGDQGRSKSK